MQILVFMSLIKEVKLRGIAYQKIFLERKQNNEKKH